jgi:UDP-N-acetylglucosamine:LPS N-acetylglucosamine transferase
VAAAERARADRDGARRDACAELGLPADRTVVAVTSGSLGSRRINTAVRGLADVWASRADLAIRHVVGRRDFADAAADEPDLPSGGLVYQLVEYEDRVDELLLAADVVVSRSGGSVAELAAVGVPAILVPLPIAPRDHQRANARSLVAAGGAVLVADEDCTPERLATELDAILTSSDRREAMAGAMRAAARPEAADRVARLIEEQARG